MFDVFKAGFVENIGQESAEEHCLKRNVILSSADSKEVKSFEEDNFLFEDDTRRLL